MKNWRNELFAKPELEKYSQNGGGENYFQNQRWWKGKRHMAQKLHAKGGHANWRHAEVGPR